MSEELSSEAVLKGLKDFQRRTVDYAFERMYGENPTCRFLVADEVGLGKTMVARGLIARIVERLQSGKEKTQAVNIVYVCSNAAIAAQNTKRLNITSHEVIPTRLTLLPRDLNRFRESGVNFISLTSGTAFDHTRRRDGNAEERLVIYGILYGVFEGDPDADLLRKGLCNLLRATVREEGWSERAKKIVEENNLNLVLVRAFQKEVCNGMTGKYADLEPLCITFSVYDDEEDIPKECLNKRYALIGKLRSGLASVCLSARRPDLVILDEFQRFKHLLTGDDEASELAKKFFQQDGVRILLLSATPYKMFTLDGEKGDDHYPDFINTLRFLYNNDENRLDEVEQLLSAMRRKLVCPDSGGQSVGEIKTALEKALLSVMCRTERVRSTEKHNAMLTRTPIYVQLRPEDLHAAKAVYELAEQVGAGDQMEYWKSVPWLCFFMRDYELGKKLNRKLAGSVSERGPVFQILEKQSRVLFETLENYGPLEAGNPRMRELFAETLDKDMWKLLWMPPSMPYMRPSGAYAGKEQLTKLLVFSAWNAVPNAVSALCSWEAERRMTGGRFRYGEFYEKSRRLFDFSRDSRKRLTGMPVLALMLPYPTLASAVDPLELALKNGDSLAVGVMKKQVRAICRNLLKDFPRKRNGKKDARWYWAAPLFLERKKRTDLPAWGESSFWQNVGFGINVDEHGKQGLFEEHVAALKDVRIDDLGVMPDDLLDVLCDMVLASPGICALRALHRIAPELAWDTLELLRAAARIALGFRRLFNVPENMELLRRSAGYEPGGESAYWRTVLKYGINGNMQAMLDEYVHMLSRAREFQELDPKDRENRLIGNIQEISGEICDSLSLRAVSASVYRPGEEQTSGRAFSARCRFALRFGDCRDDGETVVRADLVRKAFNSPFRPFVLASTSIGQEGLDFHVWCHAVMHWNLPSNPVDLEQREGRVHRYKGHAVRKNIAERYGLRALAEKTASNAFSGEDPWAQLFEMAAHDKKKGVSDLTPYWIFEGSAEVEGRVPLLPFSKDVEKFERLKGSLALYRVAFGQPRQEDLLFSLNRQGMEKAAGVPGCLVSLEPPCE